jgi:signal transduction histidine kinase
MGFPYAPGDAALTSEQQPRIQFGQGRVRELADIVDDLHDLAKVEAGRIAISPESFEAAHLFLALRGAFKPIVNAKAESLIFEERQSVSRIYTDDKKLSKMLRNFVPNVLKFTTECKVRVSAWRTEDRMLKFAAGDSGIGTVVVESEVGERSNLYLRIPSRYSGVSN